MTLVQFWFGVGSFMVLTVVRQQEHHLVVHMVGFFLAFRPWKKSEQRVSRGIFCGLWGTSPLSFLDLGFFTHTDTHSHTYTLIDKFYEKAQWICSCSAARRSKNSRD